MLLLVNIQKRRFNSLVDNFAKGMAGRSCSGKRAMRHAARELRVELYLTVS